MATMDEAFEQYRTEKFGAYSEYPIDAYTYFGAGWKAAINAISKYPDRTVAVGLGKLKE